ncbi:hypothetical protein [[Kitasatospora] papulosa]|uniref:hypothetical protein n=1 Tax=[Kitasatospora] papulosa TaxID=1464011 RepID=UPI0036C2A6C1
MTSGPPSLSLRELPGTLRRGSYVVILLVTINRMTRGLTRRIHFERAGYPDHPSRWMNACPGWTAGVPLWPRQSLLPW